MAPLEKTDLLQGTLDLLILKVVALGPVHGYGISQRIRQISSSVLQVQQGSLYPALQRLLRQGLILAEDGQSDNNRRARFYRLTPRGRRQLSLEASKWQQFSTAIGYILAPPADETN